MQKLKFLSATNDVSLSELNDDIQVFKLKIRALVQKFANSPTLGLPAIMWHYTNWESFENIVKSGTLWLSHRDGMKDNTEIKYAMLNFSEKFLWYCKLHGIDALLAQTIDKNLQSDFHTTPDIYLVSLCGPKNPTKQWEAYGDKGRGCALGFDSKALAEAFENTSHGQTRRQAFRVKYDPSLLYKLCYRIIQDFRPLLEDYVRHDASLPTLTALSHPLMIAIASFSAVFKRPCYHWESEMRLVEAHLTDHKLPHVCERLRPEDHPNPGDYANGLIRYIKFDWRSPNPAALREIAIGSNASPDAEERVRALVADYLPGATPKIWRSPLPIPLPASSDNNSEIR